MSGLDSYNRGPKNDWRRRVAAEAERRIEYPSRARGVYLAGAGDLDRRQFTMRGFNPNLLLAVEHAKESFNALSEKGTPVVYGDLMSVIGAWGERQPLMLVHADFCHGFLADVRGLINTAITKGPICLGAVVIINMLHGRENGNDFGFVSNTGDLARGANHRGHAAWAYLATWSWMLSVGVGDPNDPRLAELSSSWEAYYDKICRRCNPRFLQYKSVMPNKAGGLSVQVFDSLIFTADGQYPVALETSPALQEAIVAVAGRVRAHKAIQTRRLNGSMREAPRS